MNKELELIENYFLGKLPDEEKQSFEQRIEEDSEFAETVSFYISTRDALKKELHLQKKRNFNDLYEELAPTHKRNERPIIRKLVPYIGMAAAACFLIFLLLNNFSKKPTPEQLATTYIEENLQNLSVTMGTTEDTLQLGIIAYNNEEYSMAEQLFLALKDNEDLASEAIKYLGLTYLKIKEYDKAIVQFEVLSNMEGLYANPGSFYKAVTLMKRSKGNDVEEAKLLLKKVIENGHSGSRHAEMWMEILNG